MKPRFPTSPVEWVIAAASLAAVVTLALFAVWMLTAPIRAAQEAARARAGAIQTQERGKASQEAAVITDNAVNAAIQNEQIGRENEASIQATNGASQPLTRELNRAGLEAACRRAIYANTPRCVALRAGR